ncbi:MAG: hypothetical protein ACRYF5_06120 [Janthinobacterium lividum]
MSANKRPRKPYVSKPVARAGGLAAISANLHDRIMLSKLPPERQTNLVVSYHTSIDAMLDGRAEDNHFDSIVYALNVGLILAERGLGDQFLHLLEPALAAMHRVKRRHAERGKYLLDGDGLAAVKAVADLHRAQMEVATHQELCDAITEMHKRVPTAQLVGLVA